MRGLSTSLSCVAPSTKRQSASVVRDAPSMRIAEAKERRNLTPLTVNEPLICRSEEHTSELQSLMRISYAVFCLKKKKAKCRTTPCTLGSTTQHNTLNAQNTTSVHIQHLLYCLITATNHTHTRTCIRDTT